MFIAACGGGGSSSAPSGPLALDQRVPTEADAPGSQPDPVEKRQTAASKEEFVQKMGDVFINPTEQERAELETLPFAKAILDTRFFPSEPGAAHSQDDAHIKSLVVQFGTPDAAKRMADFFHTDGLRPCPESCAFSASEFEVDGIPDATGVRRYATEADIQAAGTPDQRPRDSYAVLFADGNFTYSIDLGGPPGTTSEEKAKEVAQALYDRVHGAPAAD